MTQAQATLQERGSECSIPQTLWMAVIRQALVDGASLDKFNRIRAREWFLHRGAQFRYVADLAGYDPDWLSEQAAKHFRKIDSGEIQTRNSLRAKSQRTRLYTYNGQSLSLFAWSQITGIDLKTLRSRIFTLHWPIERALSEPTNIRRTRRASRIRTAPGVGRDFQEHLGTGAGSDAQDRT